MTPLPIRRAQFKMADFAAWLAANGAEVGMPTNAYEVIRYRAFHGAGKRAETHIVYAKENGLLTYTGASRDHYTRFQAGADMAPQEPSGGPPGGWTRPDGGPFRKDAQPRASAQNRRRQRIIDRDGAGCWFCGLPLGDDMTFEHLVPRSKGGRDSLANYALAHGRCNRRAADLPLVKKIELRAEMHAAAQVGRNPKGRDAAERLGAEHEHAVGEADAPNPSIRSPNTGGS